MTVSAGARRWRGPGAGLLAVLALSLVCLGGTTATWSLLDTRPGGTTGGGTEVPWPVLALVFGLTEVFVLHLHVRRQRRSLSLSEVPLLLGLFGSAPLLLLTARLAGVATALVLHRRQSGAKLVFNLSVVVAETAVALHVFGALRPESAGTGPRHWLAAYAAAATASLVSHLAVSLVIAAHSRRLSARDLLEAARSGLAAAVAVATLGLVAVTSLAHEPAAGALLVAVAALVVLGYRAYATLTERHLELERLYRFSQVVGSSPEVDELLRSVLVQAKELLRTEWAEVVFLSGQDGTGGVRVALGPSDRLERTAIDDLDAAGPLWGRVVTGGAPVVAEGGSEDPAVVAYLAGRGHGAAALVPLRGEAGVLGALGVADRAGETASFTRADLQLLQTVGDQAGSALHKGRQLDELRQVALHDALTGLPNRAMLARRLGEAERDLAGGRIAAYAVLLLDLDGFKAVNDTLGHDRGDELLCDVAGRLTAALPSGATVARLGGDEFAVVWPDCTGPQARLLGDELVAAVRHQVAAGEGWLPVGTSLGIALVPVHAPDGTGAMRAADAAMYQAKRARSGVAVAGAQPSGDGPETAPTSAAGLVPSAREGGLREPAAAEPGPVGP